MRETSSASAAARFLTKAQVGVDGDAPLNRAESVEDLKEVAPGVTRAGSGTGAREEEEAQEAAPASADTL